jgi:hypothetical protein
MQFTNVAQMIANPANIVPLQQDLQWNGDLPGLLEHAAGHETPGEQQGVRPARGCAL